MAIPVRINEDNYAHLQQMAERERRSVTAQLNVILDERFGRNTVGSPIENTPPPKKNLEGKSSIVVTDDLIKQSVEGSMDRRQAVLDSAEQPCCANENRPCKHWVWDTATGEGYRNTLSGRFKEAE